MEYRSGDWQDTGYTTEENPIEADR